MKRSIRGFAVALGLLSFAAAPAFAVPVLQLDIAGGTYDGDDETIVTSADSFTVYAYLTPQNRRAAASLLGSTYYLSVAITAEMTPAGANLGSFSVNGQTYLATQDMSYGVPPIEADGSAGHDGGDLGRHGIYETHFLSIPFTFTAANRSGEYNTADDAGQGPIAGDDMYYAAFSVDKTLFSDDRELHFDLYSVNQRSNGDRDIDRFAPFSHDAGTVGSPIPEPTAALVFGAGLLLTRASLRRRDTR